MSLKTDYLNPQHPSISKLAKGLRSIKRIHAWIDQNVGYGYGKSLIREMKYGGSFAIKTDVQTLEDREGCCVGRSFLLASLARAAGFDFKFILHDSKGQGGYSWQMEEDTIVESTTWNHLCCCYNGKVFDSTSGTTWKIKPENDTVCSDDYNMFMELQTQQSMPLWVKFVGGRTFTLLSNESMEFKVEKSNMAAFRSLLYHPDERPELNWGDMFYDGKLDSHTDNFSNKGRRKAFNGRIATKKEKQLMKSLLEPTDELMKWLSKKVLEESKDSLVGYA